MEYRESRRKLKHRTESKGENENSSTSIEIKPIKQGVWRNATEHVTIGISFAFDWLREWRERGEERQKRYTYIRFILLNLKSHFIVIYTFTTLWYVTYQEKKEGKDEEVKLT